MNKEIFSINNKKVFHLIVSRKKESISTELDGETVILDIASGIYSGLDPVGTFIWNLLENPLSVMSLRDAILSQYDVSEEQCNADLLSFLKDLMDNGLIAVKNDSSS